MTTSLFGSQIAEDLALDSQYKNQVKEVVKQFNDALDPFLKKQKDYIVVKGQEYITTNPQESQENPVIKRKRMVYARSVMEAYLNDTRYYRGEGMPVLQMPTITWAGSAGYWYTATVNQDFLDANGIDYVIPEEIIRLSQALT